MTFCEPSDLLTGDMPTNPTRAQQFIDAAADEMAVKLSPVYSWPPADPLDDQSAIVLRRINTLLATGRYVMAQSVATEDNNVHSYGRYVLKEGQDLLNAVAREDIILPGLEKVVGQAGSRIPRVINEDSTSPVSAFYQFTNPFTGVVPTWGPGQ